MIYIFGGAFDPPHVGHMAIVKSILARKHPQKIVIIPSSRRNDKNYAVSDEHRIAMLDIFVGEIDDPRVTLDDHFIRNWEGEMITKDVDMYAREIHGEDITHVFGTDTIETMPSWDDEAYAAKVVRKLFVPRGEEISVFLDLFHHQEGKIENNNLLSKGESDLSIRGILSPLISLRNNKIRELGIDNFEFFTDCHIPEISSTELRRIIPDYTTLKSLFEENPKFIIPGLSKRISQYILEKRLYRTKSEEKPKILVHVCCGPDVTMPILQLRDEYDVICFWYDPNIQPKSEYDKRYEAFVKVCKIENIPYIKGTYDVKNFFSRIRGLEYTPEKGEKCTNCYDMRMYVAAKLAKKLKIPYYTSSLNTSPKKDLEKLFKMGHKYAEKYDIEFLDIPFRKRGGFEKSVEYTRKYDIYRQNYCGCVYSIREGGIVG